MFTCQIVRTHARTHVRTYVRTHICTYTPHVRSYRVSVVQSGQFKICIRAFGRTKIVPQLVPHEALNEALFLYDRKCTTERTTERPNVRPNVRPNDRNGRPNDQKRTTERPQYVRPNGHVNVRTYDQLKTHIERFLFGKTCCERGVFQIFGWTFNEETHTHNNSSFWM